MAEQEVTLVQGRLVEHSVASQDRVSVFSVERKEDSVLEEDTEEEEEEAVVGLPTISQYGVSEQSM